MPLNKPPRHLARSACTSDRDKPKSTMEAAVPMITPTMHGTRPTLSLSRPQKTPAKMDVKLYALASMPDQVPT